MTDPFESLAQPIDRQEPRPGFARRLRAQLLAELGLDPDDPPTIDLPPRRPAMTTATTDAVLATGVTPYLTAGDAAAALAWYAEAFGAQESLRIVGDDGRVGHAEFTIGTARFYLSDEYPELDVRSPATLGGSATTLHLEVADVDALFARAVAAGATSRGEPADQFHGARHGTLVDPFGHRWMLSQHVEDLDLATQGERAADTGFQLVTSGDGGRAAGSSPQQGGIWAAVFYEDALAGIRFLVDVLGFEERLVVVDDDQRTVAHSELRWPAGGIVQVGTYDADNEFSRGLAPGNQSLYLVTADPHAVWARCEAAGTEVVRPPESPHYEPDGMGFAVRDPEGNIWSVGSYGLGS